MGPLWVPTGSRLQPACRFPPHTHPPARWQRWDGLALGSPRASSPWVSKMVQKGSFFLSPYPRDGSMLWAARGFTDQKVLHHGSGFSDQKCRAPWIRILRPGKCRRRRRRGTLFYWRRPTLSVCCFMVIREEYFRSFVFCFCGHLYSGCRGKPGTRDRNLFSCTSTHIMPVETHSANGPSWMVA